MERGLPVDHRLQFSVSISHGVRWLVVETLLQDPRVSVNRQAGGRPGGGGRRSQGRELPTCLWFSPELILGKNGGRHGISRGLLVGSLRAVSALSSEKLGVTDCPRG